MRRRGIVLAFGACAMLGIVIAWPRERLLTETAHSVMKMNPEKQTLCWLSVHRLLVVTTERFAEPIRGPRGSIVKANWQGSADLVDTAAHTTSRLDALTGLLQRTAVFPVQGPSGFRASPDGLSVLWDTYYVEHGRPWSHAARLDGMHYRKLNLCSADGSLFLDSRYLIQIMLEEPIMIVCDLQDPAHDRKYVKRDEARAALARYTVQKPVSSVVSASDKNGGEGFANIDMYRTEDRIDIHVKWPGFERYMHKPIGTHTVKLPEGATLEYVRSAESSDGQFVCCHLQSTRTPPFSTWLHRLIPTFNPRPIYTESVWISRTAGHGMQELGHVPTHLDENGTPQDLLRDVRWLPDGRQISFVYEGTLYVMPAVCEK